MSTADYSRARGAVLAPQPLKDEATDKKIQETLRIELVDITELETRYGDVRTTIRTADRQSGKDSANRFNDYSMILRRRLTHEGESRSVRLEILSEGIRSSLEKILGDYPFLNMKSSVMIIEKPYVPLWHFRSAIRQYVADDCTTENEKEKMVLVVNFINMHHREVEREFDRLEPSKLISFTILWTLFKPGDIVVRKGDHYTQAFSIESSYYFKRDGEVCLAVEARSWDFNGVRYGPANNTLIIEHFSGFRKIATLPVYPLKYHEEADGGDLREKLINRGRMWKSLIDVCHRSYDGAAWKEPPLMPQRPLRMSDLIPFHSTGRVILDYSSYVQAFPSLGTVFANGAAASGAPPPGLPPPPPPPFGYPGGPPPRAPNAQIDIEGTNIDKDRFRSYLNDENYRMTDDQALICPARIRGFCLAEKVWSLFLVEKIKPVEWQEGAFRKLELDSSIKTIIRALVSTHGQGKENFDDVVSGKGKGLIFLLSGRPGLGKTLTAESIAEHSRRPLYAVTSGELGDQPTVADMQLRRVFSRANLWNAILLLDEADVFLAKRDGRDLQQNAFVSIFLRLIEYYQGILFLTTNRVMEFDKAFQSRIHLTINYPHLDMHRRSKIWVNFFGTIRSSSFNSSSWTPSDIEDLASAYDINGREIKNLLKTALAIAEYGQRELTKEDIKQVYEVNRKAIEANGQYEA